MSPRALPVLVLALLLAAGGTSALLLRSRPAPAAPRTAPALPARSAAPMATAPATDPAPAPRSPLSELPPLRLVNQTSREAVEVTLYDERGQVDEASAQRLDELLCDARDPKQRETTRIDRRTLQLLFKAAYHFQRREVEIVSAYRKPGRRREGQHGKGSAIDFRLPGVKAVELARYLRTVPRTGVGIYTHPKTQFVHLDVREHSFHWLDASPPRRRWREKSIGARDLPARDASYRPEHDLPELP